MPRHIPFAPLLILPGILFFFFELNAQKPQNELHISTQAQNPDEIRGKEAVITRLKQLFANSPAPEKLTTREFKEAPPEITVLKGNDGKSTIIYTFRYIRAEPVVEAIEAVISDEGTVELVKEIGTENNDNHTILINDIHSKLDELKGLLLALDKLQPQILVETQIVEVYIEEGAERDVKVQYNQYDASSNTNSTYGFNLDAPTQNRDSSQGGGADFFPFTSNSANGDSKQLNAAIRWLNTSRDAKILSAPNIIANQGAESRIITGEDLPIPSTTALNTSTNLSFTYRRIGVTLSITPIIINRNTVQLKVNPEVNSAIRYQSFIQDNTVSNIPVISVRSIDTRLTVADGDIIVLGGLYSSEKNESLRKIPYVGDIPVIGDLVNGRDTKTLDKQLIFFMKVHILPSPQLKAISPDAVASETHQAADIIKSSDQIITNKPPAEFFNVEEEVTKQSRLNEKAFVEELRKKAEEKEKAKVGPLQQPAIEKK